MKRIISIFQNNKEYIVYFIIGILIALIEFGSNTTIEIVALVYVIVVPTLNVADIYMLITDSKLKITIWKVFYLIITTGFIVVCYYFIGSDLRRLAFHLAVGLFVVFILIVLLFRSYFGFNKNGQ